MQTAPAFDPAAYHRAPNLNAATAIALVDGLSSTAPKEAPALARKALKRLVSLRASITAELESRRKPAAQTVPVQVVDINADKAFRAVRRFCEAYLDLQPKHAPYQDKVRDLDRLLFGDGGLAFTALPYPEQRTEMHNRLAVLDQGDWWQIMAAVAGEACVNNLKESVSAYDAMVLGLLEGVARDDQHLTPLVREVQKVVVDYARYIAATVDDEAPETASAALQALAPIDNLRRMAQSPRSPVSQDQAPAPTDPPSPEPNPAG